MQTKNINVEQGPVNNEPTSQKMLIIHQQPNDRQADNLDGPPLPPRTAIIFKALPPTPQPQVEVEGYGPYKPVPPPKPVSSSTPTSTTSNSCFTPPPYRMPPYPLYSEPSIPGSAGGNDSTPGSAVTQHGLHTHSSKFPIEREVILSSADKNSKIPILHEYKKRTKVAIAPDAPPKHMAAWTQGQVPQAQIMDNQSHQSHLHPSQTNGQQSQQDGGASVYHASYHAAPHDPYNYPAQNTGAVPRTPWHNQDLNKITSSRPYPPDEQPPTAIQIENGKDSPQKESQGRNPKGVTKTYHTIKDMISSRFKGGSGKDNTEDKSVEDSGLNNVAEELRKSIRSVDRLGEDLGTGDERPSSILKKTAGEQGIYGKPRVDAYARQEITTTIQQQQHHQFNQHMLQQQMIQQYHAQQYSKGYPSPGQQHQQVQQLSQARSQEILHQHAGYPSTPQRPPNRYGMQQTAEQNYVLMHHPQFGEIKVAAREAYNERCVDDRRPTTVEQQQRSAQQLERDNIRQKSFESRRTTSQPQLAYDDGKLPDNIAQPQMNQTPTKRMGSQGNLVESHKATIEHAPDTEKDSDDGGFLKRTGSQNRLLETVANIQTHPDPTLKSIDSHNGDSNIHLDIDNSSKQQDSGNFTGKEESNKLSEGLSGSPRKRLEGEIGKIEGVYNVGQRYNGVSDTEKRMLHRKPGAESGASSDYDKPGQSSSNADSGRGSAAYSSGRRPGLSNVDTSTESDPHQLPIANYRDSVHSSVHDPEWVDIVENELRHILEPKLHELSLQNGCGVANSTLSESISSMTPPLPPLSPGEQSSPNVTPRNSARYKHSSLPYGSKPEYGHDSYNKPLKGHSGAVGPGVGGSRWHANSAQKHRSGKKMDHSSAMRGKQIFGLDTTDIASTTTRSLDLESILDGQSDSEGDISTADARTIRKQLEGLESMYSEVLKLLGVKKYNNASGRYQPSDPRFSKRRYGSMSSLPSSSVSSRPIRDKRRAHEDRKKVKDIRGINKRFQRLESHVVTLARSVAHLSSEMRTQHLMIQEMENIRGEISALRTQTNMLNVRSQSTHRGLNSSKDLPDLTNPTRVKKLTKFFGDEPPLLRLFLKKLGYEKYANAFENERVGMVELPYLSEERLQKMGVPLGPRLRILQEAQISVCNDNTLCIV